MRGPLHFYTKVASTSAKGCGSFARTGLRASATSTHRPLPLPETKARRRSRQQYRRRAESGSNAVCRPCLSPDYRSTTRAGGVLRLDHAWEGRLGGLSRFNGLPLGLQRDIAFEITGSHPCRRHRAFHEPIGRSDSGQLFSCRMSNFAQTPTVNGCWVKGKWRSPTPSHEMSGEWSTKAPAS
jgi:hypothetical protein